ncbi:MAG: polymerase ECF-subfamily sigma factor [Labilithrix sp.]|nr:polymerase ECF-subfamily sigma factor [Labilithrix sp.]
MTPTAIRRPAAEPGLATATDTELFEGIARGALGPLGELFDRHHASVRSFAQRLLASAADADDLVQETFLTASRAAASYEAGASARPFLLGVAAQLARRRRRTFARLRGMLESFGNAPAAPPATPEEDLLRGERGALVDEALARLSHDHREIILMVDLGGLSGVEAAKALGVPAGTVWRRLHEARSELRERIQRRMR